MSLFEQKKVVSLRELEKKKSELEKKLEVSMDDARLIGKIVRHVETGADVFFLLYSAGTMSAYAVTDDPGWLGVAVCMIPLYGVLKLYAKCARYKANCTYQEIRIMQTVLEECR